MKIEIKILSHLIYDEKYLRKVLPFIKDVYFEVLTEKIIFQEIQSYMNNYDGIPSLEILQIEIEKRKDISEDIFKEAITLVNSFRHEKVDQDWLLDTTEKWCKERAIYLELMESVKLADGRDKTKNREAIPSILSEALGVSFDDPS